MIDVSVKKVEPFLKWVGGKRRMLKRYAPHFPTEFDTYIESFLGGGAVFFWLYSRGLLEDKVVSLSDLNRDLICAYQWLRSNPEDVIAVLEHHHDRHCDDYYYAIRAMDRVDPDGPCLVGITEDE